MGVHMWCLTVVSVHYLDRRFSYRVLNPLNSALATDGTLADSAIQSNRACPAFLAAIFISAAKLTTAKKA